MSTVQINPLRPSPSRSATDRQSFRFLVYRFLTGPLLLGGPIKFFFHRGPSPLSEAVTQNHVINVSGNLLYRIVSILHGKCRKYRENFNLSLSLNHGFHFTEFHETHKCTTTKRRDLYRISLNSIGKYGKDVRMSFTPLKICRQADLHEIHACWAAW